MQVRGRCLLTLGVILTVASCGSGDSPLATSPPDSTGVELPGSTAPATAPPDTIAAGTTAAPSSTTRAPLVEVDLETNITVFLDPVTVADVDQAEAVIAAIIDGGVVDSVTVVGRAEAWTQARALASQVPTPIDLDPALRDALGEVARIVVLDGDVRNRLTDDIEDSTDVAGIAYVVGVREGSSRPAVTPWSLWEILGYAWNPTS